MKLVEPYQASEKKAILDRNTSLILRTDLAILSSESIALFQKSQGKKYALSDPEMHPTSQEFQNPKSHTHRA